MSILLFRRYSSSRYSADDDVVMGCFFGAIVVLLVLFATFVALDIIYTTHGKPYEVPGEIVGYDEGVSGRTKRIFVYLSQPDGKTRRYNTYVNTSECRMAPLGTQIPVVVKPSYNELWKRHHYSSDMKYNPCR